MTHRQTKLVTRSAKSKSPVKEDSVVLQNKDLFAKFELELRSPDKILQHEGFDYYDKMLDTDAHVYSIITTRKMGAGSFPYKLIPKNDSTEAFEQMTFIQFLLNEIPIENHFFDILDAIPKGFSIHEIVSRPTDENDDFQNKIIINRLISHPQQHFIFKVKKKTGYDLYFKPADFGDEKKMPMENFLHASFDSSSPYGKPLLEKLYWYYWFKKETGFKFWAIFLEKFGGPTAIMKYPSGDTSNALQLAANEALEDLQNSSGISLPDSFSLDFAKVSQGDISYQNMIDACNAEMSKAALGATQTVEEGRRGSYALSRTHTDVRAEYKLHDVRILRKAIQPQIINRYTKINYSNPLPPTIEFIIPVDNTTLDKPDPDHKGSVTDESLRLMELVERMVALKYGGPTSGDFGHPGRPGQVGGSGAAGGNRPASRDRRTTGGGRTSRGGKRSPIGSRKESVSGGRQTAFGRRLPIVVDEQTTGGRVINNVFERKTTGGGFTTSINQTTTIGGGRVDQKQLSQDELNEINDAIQDGGLEPDDGSLEDFVQDLRSEGTTGGARDVSGGGPQGTRGGPTSGGGIGTTSGKGQFAPILTKEDIETLEISPGEQNQLEDRFERGLADSGVEETLNDIRNDQEVNYVNTFVNGKRITSDEADAIGDALNQNDLSPDPTIGEIETFINNKRESFERIKKQIREMLGKEESDALLTPGGGTRKDTGRVIGDKEPEPDESKSNAPPPPATFRVPIGIGADRKLNFINITNPIEVIKKLFATNPPPKEEPKITEVEAITRVNEILRKGKDEKATPGEVGSVGFMLLRNEIGSDEKSIQQALVNLRKFEALSQKEKNRFLKNKN